MTRHCKKNRGGFCIKNGEFYHRYSGKLINCPYYTKLEASLDCRFFDDINEDSSAVIKILNVERFDNCLKCSTTIKTSIGILTLTDIYLDRYMEGFLGYTVRIDKERGIKLSSALEKELISQVRKWLKK